MIELKKCLTGAGIEGYPVDYLTHWQGLGNHGSGYTSSVYKWDNEIDSRDFKERILSFDSLNVFDEFQTFKDLVQQVDDAVQSSVLLDILPVEGPCRKNASPKKPAMTS